MPRRSTRYTVAERRDLVERQRQSGQTAAAFCREHDLVYQTFVAWRRRVDSGDDRSGVATKTLPGTATASLPEFIELGVAQTGADTASAASTGDWLVELDLGDGLTLRMRRAA